ncbi:MAG: class I SAM-dependent methyltransferase [Gammaproteobacteria bacterium]|nr:class I SAM-dependent methyltransferase [Gammaproteobacteria bacterium]
MRKDQATSATAAPAPLPRPWQSIQPHAAMPELSHDERVRFNVVAAMNHFLAQRLLPRVREAAARDVEPALEARLGRPAADRHEYRRELEKNLTWRLWSRLRRSTMELRQQAGRLTVLRQLPELVSTSRDLLKDSGVSLTLDPAMTPPRYLTSLPSHLMPGGYVTDLVDGDVTAGASYEIGLYATLGGQSGPASDRAGRATVAWLREHRPDWRPRRILDLGCGIGANTLVLAQAFPDAEVVAVDAGAPMLRYAAARTAALGGGEHIRFVQADAERLALDEAPFDLVLSLMVLHETSRPALQHIFATSFQQLAPGGLAFHLEQPPYRDKPLIEQCLRDWDGRYNNESFWSSLHDTDLVACMREAGFAAQHVHETTANAAIGDAAPGVQGQEDYGRGGAWYVVVGEKPAVQTN